ncbi:ArsB/NhaD family transporter [Acidithiobacillus sp.]|uniref:ArsB/NhaD family transporter n=1 Tax=Acidithiobacillus sp. TaxID=1872118 RepID=UPI00262252B6|nr:ArsB/NhaD family transporter [Acidithiobacillus sp.]
MAQGSWLAVLIFLATLILVIWQPKGLSIGWSAMGGVVLATGVITWSDIPVVWHIIWDATFTFVALIIISLILDEAGFFHWATVNIVSANDFNISFDRYPLVMVLVGLVATLLVLWIAFRRVLPQHYGTAHLPEPTTAIRDHLVFRASFPVLGLLLIAYFVTARWQVPSLWSPLRVP